MRASEIVLAVALMAGQEIMPKMPEYCLQIPVQPPKREPHPPKPKFKKTWHQQGRKRR